MSNTIEIDARGRAALGKVASAGTYRATTRPDGSVLLEPAQVLTRAEIAALSDAHTAETLRRTFEGTHEAVEFDWQR